MPPRPSSTAWRKTENNEEFLETPQDRVVLTPRDALPHRKRSGVDPGGPAGRGPWRGGLGDAAQRSPDSRRSADAEPIAAQITPLSPADLPPFESVRQGRRHRAPRANPKTESPLRPRVDVLRYTVQRGDSVFGIAKKFDLEPKSVLWGNSDTLNDDPDMLQPGLDLNILPVDGVIYRWESGDTLDAVAAAFKVDPREIVDWPGNAIDPVAARDSRGRRAGRARRQARVPTVARADHRSRQRRRGLGLRLGRLLGRLLRRRSRLRSVHLAERQSLPLGERLLVRTPGDRHRPRHRAIWSGPRTRAWSSTPAGPAAATATWS